MPFKEKVRNIFSIVKQVIYIVAHLLIVAMCVDDSKRDLSMGSRLVINNLFICTCFIYSISVLCLNVSLGIF